MKPKVAVYGAGKCGQTIAADLSLAGFEVNLLESPKFKQNIACIQKLGGIHLSGENTRSGKTGFAKPNKVTTDAKEALKDVEVIFIDVPVTDYETRIKAIAPYLRDEQIINFNGYGYWPSLRVVNYLKRMGKENVILSESPVPTYRSRAKDGSATSLLIRRRLPVATFPGKRCKEIIGVLKQIFPTFEMAKSVLQSNFENINMMVHPGIATLNLGWFERAEAKKEEVGFYKTGNTIRTGILQEVQDRERMGVCQAFGVRTVPLMEHLNRYYHAEGKNVHETILNCRPYQDMTYPANIWAQWLRIDVPLAIVPFVSLANLAGVPTPIAKSLIAIIGAVLEIDFWKSGLTLKKLGLAGLTVEEVVEYVTEGRVE